MKTPNIFVSHRWKYDADYHSLKEKMGSLGWRHKDYSVPSNDPIDVKGARRITVALKEQVRQCNIFIVFARKASENSLWVPKEVKFAREYGKFILGIKPHRYRGHLPAFIEEACEENGMIVGFNAPAIIRRIEYALS